MVVAGKNRVPDPCRPEVIRLTGMLAIWGRWRVGTSQGWGGGDP